MRQVDHFLDGFFNPRSVAVVGATNNMLKVNFRLIQNLVNLGFQGKIYPINPVAKEILGLKAFAQLTDVPDEIDLAVSAVPAHRTMDIVRQCLEKGIRQLVIVTGGFSEGGESGKKLHSEIARFVRENGIRTLGPNTLSPINTANDFAISYHHIRRTQRGGVSFGFQSGFYEPKINWVLSNFRVNKILDMGNKIDINEVDALEYFALDPDTKTIALHLESIQGDARRFFEVLSEVSIRKPTIILKSGRTPAGSLAAASHTGSIARENDLIFDGMLKQTAAIRAQSQEEFFDLAKAFEYLELPQGNHLAIIMMSGGEGVMATDACEMSGMKTAQLNSKTYDKLKPILPPWDIPLNPFDAGVSMEFHISSPPAFFEALSAIPADDDVHCALMQMPPNLWDFMSSDPSFSEEMADSVRNEFTRGLLKIKGAGKPFALWRSTMDAQEKKWVEVLQSHGLPVFQSSERAVRALAAMHRFRSRKSVA
jgi:acetyltransferase